MTMLRPTGLYRLYDAEDRLLYVGIGYSPHVRWTAHSKEKGWWPQVARKSVEWHESWQVARAAETAAINAEYPLHNKSPRAYGPFESSPARLSSSARCGAWVPNRYGSEYGPPTRLACMEQRGHDGSHRSAMGVEWVPGGAPALPIRTRKKAS